MIDLDVERREFAQFQLQDFQIPAGGEEREWNARYSFAGDPSSNAGFARPGQTHIGQQQCSISRT
jgi:hypothetical protein